MKLSILILVLISISGFLSATIINTYTAAPNNISYGISVPVIQNVYLKNLSGSDIHYPKVGGTYKCYADIHPPDNKTSLSTKWNYSEQG